MSPEPHLVEATSIRPPPDPLTEIAAILAAGVRRLHARSPLCIVAPEHESDSPVESSPTGLEVPGALPLHGTAELTGGDASAAAPGHTHGDRS